MTQKKQRNCPACDNSGALDIGEKNGFRMLRCGKCRTIFTFHIPLQHEAEDYDGYYTEQNLNVPEFTVERLREIIGNFDSYRQENRLLDIGFGAGSILKVASDLGWQAFGIEVSKTATDRAAASGFEVFQGELPDARYAENYFDVITASEILEHLADPQNSLEEAARILRPGGLFWATTPFCDSLSRRLLGLNWSNVAPPEHIQLFSKKGIFLMFKKAGFSNIELKTSGLNPMEIISHFRSGNNAAGAFDRVESGYRLNENISGNKTGRLIKSVLNETLNIFQLGDSLKIYAQK